MEESLSLIGMLRESFGCEKVDIRTYSPLTFAYIGDCVFDMIVRTLVVEKGQRAANALHKHTTKIVNAATQAAILTSIYDDLLTEEEQDVYRRGRNAKSYTHAKNQSMGDYRKATGFEALCGYLYLTDRMPRIIELVKTGFERTGIEI